MPYHLLTLAIFLAAGVLWYLGMRDSVGLLVIAAGVVELVGWKRLFKKRNTA